MLNISLKTSAVIISMISFTSYSQAEKLPKQNPDFKQHVELAIKDHKAKIETALCSATTHDLTDSPKYRYDRFGFTQDNFDKVKIQRIGDSGFKTITINGQARSRNSKEIKWDNVTVECSVGQNTVRSISVTATK